jgi:enoyl-CoA hydratase
MARTTLTIEDGIGWITLDDGKVNAMSVEMLGDIARALDEVEGASAVAVLHGRGGIFSAGFDLTTFKQGRAATIAMLRAGSKVIQRILGFCYPVLTVCTGHAYPAGAFLMMAADVRFGLAGAWRSSSRAIG